MSFESFLSVGLHICFLFNYYPSRINNLRYKQTFQLLIVYHISLFYIIIPIYKIRTNYVNFFILWFNTGSFNYLCVRFHMFIKSEGLFDDFYCTHLVLIFVSIFSRIFVASWLFCSFAFVMKFKLHLSFKARFIAPAV